MSFGASHVSLLMPRGSKYLNKESMGQAIIRIRTEDTPIY